MTKRILVFLFFCSMSQFAHAQFGYGMTAKTEIYTWLQNPKDDIQSASAGSALVNIGLGPKIWLGGENVSFSAEASAVISPFALSISDFKGLGAVSFPVIGKINFGGLSTLNKEGKFGFSIGGGIQWSKTELFGLKGSASNEGVSRSMFRNYIGEIGYGFGMSGFALQVYLRYGRNSALKSSNFSFGIGYDFNAPRLKEATDPEF